MFLSSLEDVADKTRGFEAGGNDYLTKPFEILEVKARVRSLLKAKAYADAVKAAAERDLRIAREIQTGLLPADIPAQVEGTGLDVYGVLEPAHQVGGDLYEILRLGDDRVLVAVGDVSGKGIPAALFMAVTMTILRSMARQGHPPEEILRLLRLRVPGDVTVRGQIPREQPDRERERRDDRADPHGEGAPRVTARDASESLGHTHPLSQYAPRRVTRGRSGGVRSGHPRG